MKTTPNATTGTCTAVVKDNPDFQSYVATTFDLVPMNTAPVWQLNTSSGNIGNHQILGFSFPNSGDVAGQQYLLGPNGDAIVSYISVTPGNHHPYTPIQGKLIVTVDTQQKRVFGTYNLEAKFGNRTVKLEDGAFDVQGYGDEPKLTGIGSLSADVTGAVTLDYQSTSVALTNSPISDFPDSFGGLSELLHGHPNAQHYALSLRLANVLQPGSYSISLDSPHVRVVFIDLNSQLDVFRATSGQITITEVPNSTDLSGELKATFDCSAINDDQLRRVEIANAQLSIRK